VDARIVLRGDVAERQELLNATQSVTVEAASDDGWTAVASFSWNRGLASYAGEGDITLGRDDGSECFGTLLSAGVVEQPDAGYTVHAEYEIDGGSGALADAHGRATLAGRLSDVTFDGECGLALDGDA
jgi:hypothetical protein